MTKEEQDAYETACLKLIAMEDYFMDVLNKSIAIGLFGLDVANTGIAAYAKQKDDIRMNYCATTPDEWR